MLSDEQIYRNSSFCVLIKEILYTNYLKDSFGRLYCSLAFLIISSYWYLIEPTNHTNKLSIHIYCTNVQK